MSTVIQESTDYSKFESITGNRSLNWNKIDKICNDIKNGFNMLPYCPIIVSTNGKKLSVIDGQHRLAVSRKTERPVYYVVCDTLSLKQIALLNSRGEKWKASDFLSCYINLGIADYNYIREVMHEHGVGIRVAIDMLMFNTPKAHSKLGTTELFQSGEFECKYLDETNELLTLTESIFQRYSFSKDRYLIAAVQTLQKKGLCDFDRLRDKIAAAPVMMDKQVDTKSYLNNIERVYNFKSHSREVIF